MNEDSLALTSMCKRIDNSWTPEAVSKDVGKINYLYSLANTYNSIGNDWYSLTGDTVSEYDQLRKLQFPDSLNIHLETAPCLETAVHETVKVLKCSSNTNQLFCELEVSLPQAPVYMVSFFRLIIKVHRYEDHQEKRSSSDILTVRKSYYCCANMMSS